MGSFAAVLIGNSSFPLEPALPPLRCPLQDIEGMAAVLGSAVHGPYDICKLENKEHYVIHQEIYRALKKAGPDDRVLLYYSGHGKLDDDGHLYLATCNTQVADLPATSLPVAEIKRWMSNSASRQLILILDCCYSGTIDRLVRGDALYRGDVAAQATQSLRDFKGGGTYILTASTDLQRAEEREGDQYGLLTKHIIGGIQGGGADRDDDGLVSMHELLTYVQDKVAAEGSQRPWGYALHEQDGGLVLAKTGRPALTRKRLEVLKAIYESGLAHRASPRMIRSALTIMTQEAGASSEAHALSTDFINELFRTHAEPPKFTETLEHAAILAERMARLNGDAIDSVKSERDIARQALERLSSELAATAEQSRVKEVEVERLQSEWEAIRDRSNEWERERQTIQLEVEKLRVNEVQWEREVSGLTIAARALETQLTEARHQVARSEASARILEEEVRTLKRRLADSLAAAERVVILEREMQSSEQVVQSLERLLQDKQRELATLTSDYKLAADEIARLQQDLEKRDDSRKPDDASRREARRDALVALLLPYVGSDFYAFPHIPSRKLQNAAESCNVPLDDEIVGLINCTVFGSAKDCVLFGLKRVYFRSFHVNGGVPARLEYSSTWIITRINKDELSVDGQTISMIGSSFPRIKMEELLQTLSYRAQQLG